MPTVSLPANPTLENLRNQARSLQRAVRARDPRALALVALHHPDGSPADPTQLRLSAAQLVIARSYGFASWPQLKHHLDLVRRHLWRPGSGDDPADVADQFGRLACLTYTADDSPDRWAQARTLLAANPQLTQNNVWAAAAANDLAAVRRLIAADASLAAEPGGPNGWRPLFYLCYSRLEPQPASARVLGIARLLLDAGADPHEGYLWAGLATPFTLLTGAFGEGEQGPDAQPAHQQGPALARLILESGADPNDGQTLYNRMFRPANDHLELLFSYGLGSGDGGPWKARLGDALASPTQMLRGQLEWAVSHGQLARVRLLAEHGVDIHTPFDAGRSPAQVAAVNGNDDIVEFLVGSGAGRTVMEPVDEFVAAAMGADRTAVERTPKAVVSAAMQARPGLIVWAAANQRIDVVGLLVELGFDVNAFGRGDSPVEQPWETALHHAAGNGDLDLTRLLLAAGANPDLLDRRFHATPCGWAVHAGQPAAAALLTPLT